MNTYIGNPGIYITGLFIGADPPSMLAVGENIGLDEALDGIRLL